jgi:crotonobetainyl-CoA:carnitine CoA-transferase CaiB-like acyl-CoA transferase
MKTEFFKNLKVIEVASVLAGPSVGLFFAELGSEVIKIENKKTKGDVTRSWKLPSEDKNTNISAYFCSVNWHKTYQFVDLSNSSDLQIVKNLIDDADIVILNFKKGDDIKFELDYTTLKKTNSKLIYGNITGFGEESDRVAYDLILQAETGFMSMNGTPSSGPVKMPVALIDVLAGHQLKEGLLVALIERFETGLGSKVSVSLYDSAIASLANQATNWLMGNHVAKPIGSVHPNICPYGELFTTKDNHTVTFAIGSNKQFINLCKTIGLDLLIKDELYLNNVNRVKNRESLSVLLSKKVKDWNACALIKLLHLKFVPVAKINTIEDVFNDPMAQSLILLEQINGINTKRVKTVIFK